MTNKFEDKDLKEKDLRKSLIIYAKNVKKKTKVFHKILILTGFKICKSCRTSKTVFPL